MQEIMEKNDKISTKMVQMLKFDRHVENLPLLIGQNLRIHFPNYLVITLTHSLSINVILHAQHVCDWQFSVVLFIHYGCDKFQLGCSTFLNYLWWSLTNFSLDNHNLYFPLLPSLKSVQYTVYFPSYVWTNSLLHLNTESRLFSFNQFRKELVVTCFSFLMLRSMKALPFHYVPNASYLLAWGSKILMNEASSFWYSCYTFDHMYIKKLLYK